jgi:hypothetical protein
MESTDKLRNYVSAFISPGAEADLLGIADEIEREIAERYMELPVDADGVPVKLGDTIGKVDNCDHYTFTVEGYTSVLPDGIGELMLVDEHDDCWYPKNCIHVKPRTIEDVLRDMLNAYDRHEDGDMPYSFIAEYADELRELGVGE